MRYCTNCNAPMDDNATYCVTCGAMQNPQASNPQAGIYAQYSRKSSNQTLAAVSLIVGIAFACFFAANLCEHIASVLQLFRFDFLDTDEDGFISTWLVVLCYLAATVLSVVAGGCLYSYFSKRQ